MRILFKLLLISLPIVLLNACYYDKEQDLYPNSFASIVDLNNVSYTSNVLPIFNANCAGGSCHSGGSTPFNFGSYTTVKTYLDLPANNLICSIDWTCSGGSHKMPQGATTQLAASQITIIKNWVSQGYKNN
jgi:hypothetical protein